MGDPMYKKLIELDDIHAIRDINGHPITGGTCLKCKKHLENYRSIHKHMITVHAPPPKGQQKLSFIEKTSPHIKDTDYQIPQDLIPPERVKLIEAICASGWSLNSVTKNSFKELMDALNPEVQIPGLRKLRADVIAYSKLIQQDIIKKLNGK